MARSVNRLSRFVQAVGSSPVFVGIDVHKRSYSIALLSPADGLIETYTHPADVESFTAQLTKLGLTITAIAYETGPTGFTLARRLIAEGFKTIVAAASRIPRGGAAEAKSDRIDATKLARYLSSGLLSSVAIPTEEQEGYRALVRRRKRLAEVRAKCKQRIKGYLLFLGIREPASLTHWTKSWANDLMTLGLDDCNQLTMASYVRELQTWTEELRLLDRHIADATKRLHPERFQRLTAVDGVGEIAATTFLSEIFMPDRFRRKEEIASYLGLAPVVHRSGDGPVRAKLRSAPNSGPWASGVCGHCSSKLLGNGRGATKRPSACSSITSVNLK